MTVRTHVRDAHERVERKQEHVEAKLAGFEQFEQALRELSGSSGNDDRTARTDAARTTHATDGGVAAAPTLGRTSQGDDRACRVRTLFAETVHPHCGRDDEPVSVLASVRDELGEELALVLAPTTGGITPELERGLLSATARRRAELAAVDCALDVEAESLDAASEEIEVITDWLVRAEDTALTQLGFESLRERHETLACHRETCDRLARERQETLRGTTSHDAAAGVGHRPLVESLYGDSPVSYPVLSSVTRLDALCADCQRVVRDHLVRRV